MLRIITIHNKKAIERFLRRNVYLHIYSIGDLDDFFWPYTIWYAGIINDRVCHIVLIYFGGDTPVVIALCDSEHQLMCDLLVSLRNLLPREFYAHLSLGLVDVFGSNGILSSYGNHYKMGLTHLISKPCFPDSFVRLNESDTSALIDFYRRSYPDNWFDARMLETGMYLGYRSNGRLTAVAGVHVYSKRYRVAALGNIATDPEYRGKGLCKSLTSSLCQELMKTVDCIGLNVQCNNSIGISCYKSVGFEPIATYAEYRIRQQD